MVDITGRVLVVDNDRDIADIVQAVLVDAGFGVSVLTDTDADPLQTVVERFQPDCVLLDGQGPGLYGCSWSHAAWLRQHEPTVLAIMFTADQPAADEARAQQTDRSRHAAFSDILTKPFDIDDLIRVVEDAIRRRGGG